MSVNEALAAVLSAPSASDLWRLRCELLEAGTSKDSKVWSLLDRFHEFLERLETTSSSRDYSNLASKLDIGAISGVILERLAERGEASEQALRLLSGITSEGLMALATRQHVRAWESELDAVYRAAAWYLYEQLWHWTSLVKPELDATQRRQLLDLLVAPIRSSETTGTQKAVLVGRLFQILLIGAMSAEMPDLEL
jgi:hypothetical protein